MVEEGADCGGGSDSSATSHVDVISYVRFVTPAMDCPLSVSSFLRANRIPVAVA
jgi:hypothetical protein